MPEAVAATNAAPAQDDWTAKLWSVGKSVAFFVAIQAGMRLLMGGGGAGQTAKPAVPTTTPGAEAVVGEWSAVPELLYPLWPSNTTVDVTLYISPSVVMPAFRDMPSDSLVVKETNFALDRAQKDYREVHKSFAVPKSVQDNGTLWAHIFVGQTGAELDPASPSYNPAKAYRMLRPLTSYLAKKKVHKVRNLLGPHNDTELEPSIVEEEPTGPSIASYYHPNFTLSFVPDTGNVAWATLHPAVKQFYIMEATGARDETGKNGWYYPVLYLNTFWQLKSQMTELNSTIPQTTLPINVGVSTLAGWQFSVMCSMDEGMKQTARKAAHGESTPGGGDGSEMELIKETLLDTNPWLLGTTVFASVLHMIFELLAFKSDVGHWRKKKDNVGVSFRTILANVVMQTVIFLYLMDNNDNTSWMILFGQGMGIAIEAWKITKTVDVRIRQPTPTSYAHKLGLPYTIVFEDKHVLSETEEQTEEYDRIAFQYMGYLAGPLLLAYAIYSLYYEEHKSWYSFIITTLVGSVYAYGFLMMVPALYINYRLKSVAHMPGRTMAYKFLNTFIDDLFAFTIKMPILHRLATLRDDVIFFVYLYQAWAYKVDYTRVNEFGQGGDEEEEEAKKAAKPLTSSSGKSSTTDVSGELKAPLDGKVKGSGSGAPGTAAVSSGKDEGSARKRRG